MSLSRLSRSPSKESDSLRSKMSSNVEWRKTVVSLPSAEPQGSHLLHPRDHKSMTKIFRSRDEETSEEDCDNEDDKEEVEDEEEKAKRVKEEEEMSIEREERLKRYNAKKQMLKDMGFESFIRLRTESEKNLKQQQEENQQLRQLGEMDELDEINLCSFPPPSSVPPPSPPHSSMLDEGENKDRPIDANERREAPNFLHPTTEQDNEGSVKKGDEEYNRSCEKRASVLTQDIQLYFKEKHQQMQQQRKGKRKQQRDHLKRDISFRASTGDLPVGFLSSSSSTTSLNPSHSPLSRQNRWISAKYTYLKRNMDDSYTDVHQVRSQPALTMPDRPLALKGYQRDTTHFKSLLERNREGKILSENNNAGQGIGVVESCLSRGILGAASLHRNRWIATRSSLQQKVKDDEETNSAQEGRNDQQTPQMAKMNVIVANRADEAENEVMQIDVPSSQTLAQLKSSVLLKMEEKSSSKKRDSLFNVRKWINQASSRFTLWRPDTPQLISNENQTISEYVAEAGNSIHLKPQESRLSTIQLRIRSLAKNTMDACNNDDSSTISESVSNNPQHNNSTRHSLSLDLELVNIGHVRRILEKNEVVARTDACIFTCNGEELENKSVSLAEAGVKKEDTIICETSLFFASSSSSYVFVFVDDDVAVSRSIWRGSANATVRCLLEAAYATQCIVPYPLTVCPYRIRDEKGKWFDSMQLLASYGVTAKERLQVIRCGGVQDRILRVFVLSTPHCMITSTSSSNDTEEGQEET